MNKQSTRSHAASLWGWPVAVGLVTAAGLVGALFGDDGLDDWLADLCLAVPVVVMLWFSARRQHDSANDRP